MPEQGGRWDHETGAGIALRDIYDISTIGRDSVASSNMKNSHSYTDNHTVDEDETTIAIHGGNWAYWFDGSFVGVMQRDLYSIPSFSNSDAAS